MARHLLCFFILACSLASCSYGKPLKTGSTDNNFTYEISYLFSHDGCNVYRFIDVGGYVYFTNCNGEAIAVSDSTRITNRTTIIK